MVGSSLVGYGYDLMVGWDQSQLPSVFRLLISMISWVLLASQNSTVEDSPQESSVHLLLHQHLVAILIDYQTIINHSYEPHNSQP